MEASGGGEASETEVSESSRSNLGSACAAFAASYPGTCPDGQSDVKDRSRSPVRFYFLFFPISSSRNKTLHFTACCGVHELLATNTYPLLPPIREHIGHATKSTQSSRRRQSKRSGTYIQYIEQTAVCKSSMYMRNVHRHEHARTCISRQKNIDNMLQSIQTTTVSGQHTGDSVCTIFHSQSARLSLFAERWGTFAGVGQRELCECFFFLFAVLQLI